MYKIKYKCNFADCKKVYECEEGFYARLDCGHKDGDGTVGRWYPVQIIVVEKIKSK